MSLFLSTYYSRSTSLEHNCFKVVILNRSVLQAKIIANQFKAALMPYTNNFKVMKYFMFILCTYY
jgi:glutamyl-tRNA reductase